MGLKNYQYNKILREYDSRQFSNRHRLEKRTQEVYDKIPKLKDIDDEIISNSMNCARDLLINNQSDLEDLKDKNLELSMRKIELLIDNGYPSDYLQPQYICQHCKDTGYINNEKCRCFKQAIVDLVYSQSNIKKTIEEENFSNFNLNYYDNSVVEQSTNLTPYQNAMRVVEISKNFIENFDKKYSNILLYGNTGVGKTFLANCIAKDLLDSAHSVIYLTAFQLFDILAQNMYKKEEDFDAKNQFEYILTCDLLIIDDLGTELNNTFVSSQFYLCINERHLGKKSTIISTNLSLDEIKVYYSERVFSRITSNFQILKMVGEDIRLKKVFS